MKQKSELLSSAGILAAWTFPLTGGSFGSDAHRVRRKDGSATKKRSTLCRGIASRAPLPGKTKVVITGRRLTPFSLSAIYDYPTGMAAWNNVPKPGLPYYKKVATWEKSQLLYPYLSVICIVYLRPM